MMISAAACPMRPVLKAAGAQKDADIVLYTPTVLFVKNNTPMKQNGRAQTMHGQRISYSLCSSAST